MCSLVDITALQKLRKDCKNLILAVLSQQFHTNYLIPWNCYKVKDTVLKTNCVFNLQGVFPERTLTCGSIQYINEVATEDHFPSHVRAWKVPSRVVGVEDIYE